MRSAFLALLLCLPALTVAQANTGVELRNSGTDYVRICGATAQGQASSYAAVCNVWMTGVVDGLQAYNANSKTPFFDAPDVTVGQVAKLVVKYVNDHPASAKLQTPGLVLAALVDAYRAK
jgi:Rap1a immunity proteins